MNRVTASLVFYMVSCFSLEIVYGSGISLLVKMIGEGLL